MDVFDQDHPVIGTLAPHMVYPGLCLTKHAGLWVAGRRHGRHFIAAGPPCGPRSQLRAAVKSLETESVRQGLRTLWFGATGSECEAMHIHPTRRIHLGDEALLNAHHWADIHSLPASLRYQIRRGSRHGLGLIETALSTETWLATVREHDWLPQALHDCRHAWLRGHGPFTLGFMTSALHPEHRGWLGYSRRYLWAAHTRPSKSCGSPKIWGYIIASHEPGQRGMRIENFVRQHDAPNGLLECLLHRVALKTRALGQDELNLGLTPLFQGSVQESSASRNKVALWPTEYAHAPAWFAALALGLRRFGNSLYSFRGLAQFKQRMHPGAWRALYLAVPADGFKITDALAVAQAFLKA